MAFQTFHRKNGRWYIHLPQYLNAGGSEDNLEMVAGADVLLDKYAGHESTVILEVSTSHVEGADTLLLDRTGTIEEGNGAFYTMQTFKGKSLCQQIWLCDVLMFVFGHIPQCIYVKSVE